MKKEEGQETGEGEAATGALRAMSDRDPGEADLRWTVGHRRTGQLMPEGLQP